MTILLTLPLMVLLACLALSLFRQNHFMRNVSYATAADLASILYSLVVYLQFPLPRVRRKWVLICVGV